MKNILFIAQEAFGLEGVLSVSEEHATQKGKGLLILAIGEKVKFLLRKERRDFIDINDFLPFEDNLAIDRFARYCAEEWFKDQKFDDVLEYRSVNLGRATVNGFDEYLAWIAKQYMVTKRLLFRGDIEEVILFSVKNEVVLKGEFNDIQDMVISEIAKEFCRDKGISYKFVAADKAYDDRMAVSPGNKIKGLLKGIAQGFLSIALPVYCCIKRDRRKKGILFSSSYRIVKEVMGELLHSIKYSIFYLREGFSVKQSVLFTSWGIDYLVFPGKKPGKNIATKMENLWDGFLRILEKGDTFVFDGFSLDMLMKSRLKKIYEKTFASILVGIDYCYDLLEKEGISLIVVDEDVCVFNKTLVMVANNLGIKSVVVQHGFLGSVKEFRRAFFPLNATKMAVWGEITKEVLLTYGIQEKAIAVTGCPWLSGAKDVFKKDRDEIKRSIGLNTRYKTILYPDQCVLEDHLHIASTSSNATMLVQYMTHIIKMVLEFSDTQLIIKSHPGLHERMMSIIQSSGELSDLLEELKRQKRVCVIDQHNILELIAISDLVIFDTTTVGFEAVYLDKAVVHFTLMPTQKEPFYFKYGAFYYATSEFELKETVRRALEFPNERDENRLKFVKEYFYDSPRAVSRAVELIESMIS